MFLGCISYLLFQTFLLWDVLFSHSTLCNRWTDDSILPLADTVRSYSKNSPAWYNHLYLCKCRKRNVL